MEVNDLIGRIRAGGVGHFALVIPPWRAEREPIGLLQKALEERWAQTNDPAVLAEVAFGDTVDVQEGDMWRGPVGRMPLSEFLRGIPAEPCTIVLNGFERLDPEGQIHWISSFRSVRERGARLSAIFAGPWYPRWMLGRARANHYPSSLGLDRGNIAVASCCGEQEVLEFLSPRLNGMSERVRRAMVSMVMMYTGGDAELMHAFMDIARGAVSAREIEACAVELSDRTVVEDLVQHRVCGLSSAARRILCACLRYGAVRGRPEEVDGLEELWVQGFIRARRLSADIWVEANPIIGAILRRFSDLIGASGQVLIQREELAATAHPVLAAAAEVVLEIEGALRNLIVQEYCELMVREDGEAAFRRGGSHPLAYAGRGIWSRVGDGRGSRRDPYDEANRRREFDLASPKRFVSNPLSAQLDVADLEHLLLGEDLREVAERIFGDVTGLRARLATFSELRNAVAHNKSCSVGLLEELESLGEYLLGRMAVAGARAARPEPSALVAVSDQGGRVIETPRGIVFEVIARSQGEFDVHGVVIRVEFEYSGTWKAWGRSVSRAIRRGECAKVRVECEGVKVAPSRWSVVVDSAVAC